MVSELVFKTLKSVNNPYSIHGIYPYRGKISAVDAQQLIRQLPKQGILLDPFCGSGTILYEARKHGLSVIGVDSNPIAVQISKGKISTFNKDESIEKIKGLIDSIDLTKKKTMPPLASRSFHDKTANQIMHLKEHYDEFNDYEKAVFLGTICLAARGCNNYRWSSTQIGSVSETKLYIDFFQKFLMKLEKHALPVDTNHSKIIEGDARKLSQFIKTKRINYVYTSPPYFDALDYTSNYTRIIHYIFNNNVKELKEKLIQDFNTYSDNMKKCFEEIKKVTTDDALIIFVVGDKKKGDKVINGGEFFTSITNENPTHIIQREYTGTASKIWDKINNTQRKEQIIIWDKSKW